jgi:hypothetical protein
VTVGDGLAAGEVGAVAVAAAGLVELVASLVWVAWACAAREPAKVSIMTLTAATTHTVTATAATATPGLARMLPQLACLIAHENRANHIRSARRATRLRYATASSAAEVHRLRTCSRSSWGSEASGTRRKNVDGRIAPHP